MSIVTITLLLFNFDMNIKSIKTFEDQIAIYIGIFATIALIISLIWSGWRLLDIKKTLNGVMLETAKDNLTSFYYFTWSCTFDSSI